MFSERTHQVQVINEDVQEIQPKHDSTPKKTEKFELLQNQFTKYFKLFLNTSSIHGLNHIVAARRQFMESILWLSIIVISGYGSLYLSSITWGRYQSSPTVISMDRDMFAWNTTFPCVTICPNGILNIDHKKLELYLNNSKVENKTALQSFIIGLANASYKSFEYVPEYFEVPPEEYVDLLLNLSLEFKPTLTIGVANVALNVVPTITEMGLCYAINSRTAIYNSPEYRAANRWDIIKKENQSLFIHPLDGEVFAQVMNMSSPYNVFLHGPQEIPDVTSKSQQSADCFYMKLYVTALTVYTSEKAAELSVNQRRCRFPHENNLKHNSIYTYTMCRMECRINLCLKYCKCIPHFYRKIGDEKICNATGLKCLSEYKGYYIPLVCLTFRPGCNVRQTREMLYTLRDKDKKRINCPCFPLCDDVIYVLQSNTLQEWFLGTNLQWGMVSYPRMRYRRDVIFGFTDLLVSVGGMAGLFLGCSVLSFVEIVYFITLRLISYKKSE